jgi:uncharacterized protein YndB with AHSA1/START domain
VSPDLDLGLGRITRAPRERVWQAWTDSAKLARWWIPRPAVCPVQRLEARAGPS